jgi:hypothetical protein
MAQKAIEPDENSAPPGPFFIIGCGRSGTTILGRALSKHPAVTYLNEPRSIWTSCFPESDIWTEHAAARCGKLVFSKSDATGPKAAELKRLFHLETIRTGRPVLVEKLPINSFRIAFLHALFPEARFVHIFRNGLEVARSIEKLADKKWFGFNDYKWNLLAAHARSRAETAQLPAACDTDYERGLLEWRLATEAVRKFADTMPALIFHEILYDELIADPIAALRKVMTFMGLDISGEVENFARANISGTSEKIKIGNLTEKQEILAGEMLRLYRDAEGEPARNRH